MILVDSSVWIDYFNSRVRPAGVELHRLIGANEPVVLAGLVITEILQGMWRDAAAIISLLARFPCLEDQGLATYIGAAALAQEARRRGITIGTVDAVLARISHQN